MAFTQTKIKVIEPYDTELMVYDKSFHRYYLTLNAIISLGGSYSNDIIATQRLKEITNNVYLFIYTTANQSNRYYNEFLISCTEDGRQLIQDTLFEQLRADLESRQNDIVKQPAIDFSKGLVIDRNEIIRNRISVNAEAVLNSGVCGINILSSVAYANNLFNLTSDRYTIYNY